MNWIKAIWKAIDHYSDQKTNVQLGIWCKVDHPSLYGVHEFRKSVNSEIRHCAYCGVDETLDGEK